MSMINALLQPGQIGAMTVKNRVFLAPMGHHTHDLDGGYSPQETDYFAARARGGVGMVIAGGMVTSRFDGMIGNVFESEAVFSRFEQFVDTIHSYDCKVCVQLSPGIGRVGGALPHFGAPVSASAVPAFWDPSQTCRALEEDEIAFLVEAYGKAAAMVQRAGADCINVHGYGGYLIDQFMTSIWNRRTDRYGGSLENRMRFALELVEETKRVCGSDYPQIFKLSPAHFFEGGRGLDEGIEIARMLEAAGVHALHVDAGAYESWDITIPTIHHNTRRHQVDLAKAIKAVVEIPVLTGGKLGQPAVAERVLADGHADFIGLGRPLLADPDWTLKLEQQRSEEIIACIYCNEGCIVRIFDGMRLGCAVNAATGKEAANIIRPAPMRKAVLVIGGGPGGLEAAIQAAKAGHDVEVWEQAARLGGTLWPAAAPSFKTDIAHYITYLLGVVERLGIAVSCNTEADAKSILLKTADLVILATGAAPYAPPIGGLNQPHVHYAVDVLNGAAIDGQVLMVGGGLVGVETAIDLAIKGHDVTLIEQVADILPEKLFPGDVMKLRAMIAERGVTVRSGTRLIEINGHSARCDGGDVAADSIVIAAGYRAHNPLEAPLRQAGQAVTVIGDAVAPRRVQHAVWEGFHAIKAFNERLAI